jgi:O-antigen/teichoic acid export membrane protein
MFDYLRRLATTGAAYTASSILSKLIAVFLLPLYTRYLSPSDYGAAEVLLAAVIVASIIVRFGMIEAILRFYYLDDVDRRAVVATGFAALLWTSTAAAALALALAAPISTALLGHEDASLVRIAILGLWGLTLWEYVLALLRLEERARAYFTLTIANVVVTIPLTVWLVVLEHQGPQGLLIATYSTVFPFIAYRLWEERGNVSLLPDRGLLRRMTRFGLPTMPAELSLYSLNFIDRIVLVRKAGLAEAGLYALAVKFGQGMNVIARAFQLAWPPLAYSIEDDDEARRAYALVFTWFAALCAFAVTGMWLFSRWIVRLLAAPDFFRAHEAVGLLATGVALYALYLVQVVILGRTGRTEFSFPATIAGTAVNLALNLALVPPLGIVGAGLALVASYLLILVLTYAFTQRLFAVPYEWRRLALALGLAAATVGLGELVMPTSGIAGFLGRAALWLSYPIALTTAGFLTAEERAELGRLLSPRAVAARLRRLREPAAAEPSPGEAPTELGSELLEATLRDDDSRS